MRMEEALGIIALYIVLIWFVARVLKHIRR
jgi:hypothetical protein